MEIFELKDAKAVPDIIHLYPDKIKNESTPLVIDNGKIQNSSITQFTLLLIKLKLNIFKITGSYNCRVGWASEKEPNLIFKNLIAKPRKERGKKDGELQVGNDIVNIEAMRFQLKTQFDRNIVTHFEAQELIFDYAFTHMGIDTEESVNHPIVLTEALLNPNSSRNRK